MSAEEISAPSVFTQNHLSTDISPDSNSMQDQWKIDHKIFSKAWRASIRVRLVLAENEISSPNYSKYYELKGNMQKRQYLHPVLDQPYGVDLLIGRNAYLLEASKEIIEHFHSFSINYLEVLRLTYNQVVLNLSLPMGVLHDAYCPNEEIMEIYVHFQIRPAISVSTNNNIESPAVTSGSSIVHTPSASNPTIPSNRKSQTFPSIPYASLPDWSRKSYLHTLKQAYTLLRNSTLQMVKPDTQHLLFHACQIGESKTFLTILESLLPIPSSVPSSISEETRRAVPVRLIKKSKNSQTLIFVQKFLPKCLLTELKTLREILENSFEIKNLSENFARNPQFILAQGVSVRGLLDFPLPWVWNHLMSGDLFLYLVLNEPEKD